MMDLGMQQRTPISLTSQVVQEMGSTSAAETMRRVYRVEHSRRFSYGGTAGVRNVHVMSGRVE
jgi:hypothetical protein